MRFLPQGGRYRLRYIGQSKSRYARQRLRNHLFIKSDRTGAMLDKIKVHVGSGGFVGVSWASIEPEALRHYVEERLIERHPESDWNTHGR